MVFLFSSTKCNFKHIHDPNQIFAMMLYKPIVSLIAIFATASCAAASATPLRRRGDDGYSPRSSASSSQCTTGTQQCCPNNAPVQGGVFLGCTVEIGQCSGTVVCCNNEQVGLVNVGCSPIAR